MIEAIKWDGKPISKASYIADLDMAVYHSQKVCVGPSVSSSGLRTIWSKSPAHFFLESDLNPTPQEPEDRPHFSIGRAAGHLLYLGRKGFDDEYVVRPAKWKDWRTDDAKAWRAEQTLRGRTVLTDTELENIAGMARSLEKHPLIKAGILDGAVERSLIWQDEQTGVWLKSRPDCIPNDSGDVVDLKTCASVDIESIRRSMADYGYHVQGALCASGMKHVLDLEIQSFSFVWIEKTEPWPVRVTTLPPEDLVRGRMQAEAATAIFADCVKTGDWYGPGGTQHDAEYLGLPAWSRKQIDERLEILKGGSAAMAETAADYTLELS